MIESIDQRLPRFAPFLSRGFNVCQVLPNLIDHGKQRSAEFNIQRYLSRAKRPQQVFSRVRQLFDMSIGQKPCSPFDGVYISKDAMQQAFACGVSFETNQVSFELLQVVMAFDEKLTQRFGAYATRLFYTLRVSCGAIDGVDCLSVLKH